MFTLNEALEVIKNKPEFVCNERAFGFVIDYNVAFADSFKGANARETLILQNIRGTCFDQHGKIIRLAYHKFHNLNENSDYAEANFQFGESHIVQEKLDGSMITPIPLGDGWKFGTRAGVTDVADKAQRLLDSWSVNNYQKYLAYTSFIERCLKDELTPIFEFCSREQRIVIDYPEPALVVTGVRSNQNGEYITVSLRHYVGDPRIDVVRTVSTGTNNISEYAKIVKELKGQEGVVVKFWDGRFCKIKGDDYCLKHRALDGLRFEKDVLRLVLENGVDDVLPLVTEEMKVRLLAYQESVQGNVRAGERELVGLFEKYRNVATKKEFAELVTKSPYKTGLFKMWDGTEYSLAKMVLSKCNSATSVEEVRWLIGKSWNEF